MDTFRIFAADEGSGGDFLGTLGREDTDTLRSVAPLRDESQPTMAGPSSRPRWRCLARRVVLARVKPVSRYKSLLVAVRREHSRGPAAVDFLT